ncbi:MAG TPA: hypothetical protein VHQ42_05965 [Candidatus Limnocylindria bacterium]|nr:hypothetical protein [Candidatus Limnocylindria bacterium]
MRMAFGTGALATGVAAVVVSGLLVWVAGLLLGWSDPWPAGIWVVGLAGIGAAVAAYVAEWIAYRRTLTRMRSIGEPWAYREGGRDRS